MNRFVAGKSILFLVLAWTLTATLFADGANLDDLCSGAIVLHDDDEATAPDAFLAQAAAPQHHAQAAPKHHGPSDSKQLPATPVRVIVDQDSPSLAADTRLETIFEAVNTATSTLVIHRAPPARDALHLQLCTLLI